MKPLSVLTLNENGISFSFSGILIVCLLQTKLEIAIHWLDKENYKIIALEFGEFLGYHINKIPS